MIIDFSNVNGGGGSSGYTLPIASQSTLGGIKVGQNLTIDSGGTLSADAQAVSVATTATTGVVQVGSGLSITSGGVLSTDIDLSNYAEKSELSGYVQTSAMSGYVETSALTDYATNESLSAYQTTQGMSGYVETSDLENYATTDDLEDYATKGEVDDYYSHMKYVETEYPLISGVYIDKVNEDSAILYYGAKSSFAIKYDQMFQSQEGEPIELANSGNFVDFKAKYDYVDDLIKVEYASSVDDFEEWTEVIDGDTIEITFGDVVAKAAVGITFNGSVTINYELGLIRVDFNAEDGWVVDSVGNFNSEWTKIADKDGNPLPKSFNGMLYNEEGKLQKGDYYLVTNNGNEQITVDPPYSDTFGIEIFNIYIDADATILKTDYNKEENNQKKGTRSLPPYVRIYRDMDNNLVFEVYNGQDTTEYTYEYEDGMSVGIDMDGYSLINGEQQDEIIEGGGMTFSDTTLFREDEDANAKFVNFCIKQYDEDNDEYYDLYYDIYLKYKYKENGMSCVLASENYESIISNYSSDAELHFELFSNDEYRISKLEKAIEELQNGGGGGGEEE